MGILDSLKAQASQALGIDPKLIQLASSFQQVIEQQGGFAGLSQRFQDAGLSGILQSWISTGPNLSIQPEQIQKVFGNQTLQALAQKVGITPEMLSQQLAQHLPNIVDKLSPEGHLPTGKLSMDQLMSLGKTMFNN